MPSNYPENYPENIYTELVFTICSEKVRIKGGQKGWSEKAGRKVVKKLEGK